MAVNIKPYLFTKGTNPALDAEFSAAPAFSKVRPGQTVLFWKSGFRWYHIPFAHVERIFRRVEHVFGRLCCGGRNFDIEYLVLLLNDETELVIHIGDDVKRQAEALLRHLKEAHPELQYGKETNSCSEK